MISREKIILGITGSGVFLVALDVSIVNVAFEMIVGEWGEASRPGLIWVLSAYSIAYAAGLLAAGRFSDVYGHKKVFLLGMWIFCFSSLMCALSSTPMFLIAMRILQAIGGSILTPSSLALILSEFSFKRRSVAIGVWGAIGGVAAASGPVIGGIVTHFLGWRGIFIINIPLCILSIILAVKFLRPSQLMAKVEIPDVWGALIITFGVALIVFYIIQGSQWGYFSGDSLIVIVLSVVLIISFFRRCLGRSNAILDLQLLTFSFVRIATISRFLFSVGFFAMFFANIQWLQVVWQYDVITSALAVSPGPITVSIVSIPAGHAAERYGHRYVTAFGAFLLATGIVIMNLVITDDPSFYWKIYFPAMILTGAGAGMCISPFSSAATAYLPKHLFALGAAFNTMFRQIGAAIGVAIAGICIASAIRNTNPSQGFHITWWATAVTVYMAGLVMLIFFKKPPPQEYLSATDI